MNFTPAPWHVEPTECNPNSLSICAPHVGIVAEIDRDDQPLIDLDHNDAKLIAAAPMMYAALVQACAAHEKYIGEGFELLPDEAAAYVLMRAALALVDPAYADDDEDLCSACGGLNDDGEGWDGLCGNCADLADDDDAVAAWADKERGVIYDEQSDDARSSLRAEYAQAQLAD